MRPLPRQPRLQIAELRDLDLQLALEGVRALGEDVENQLAAIDHANLEFIFEIARLRGAERVVENRQRRALRLRELAHFTGLTLADESTRIRRLEALPNNPGNFRAGAFGQSLEFVERFFAADSRLGTKLDSDQDSALVILVNNVVRLSQVITSIGEILVITLSDTVNTRYGARPYTSPLGRGRASGAGEGAWIQLDASALTRRSKTHVDLSRRER